MKEVKQRTNDATFELNRKLRDAYQSLPLSIYSQVRDELCKECYWSNVTFYSRINSVRPVKGIEIPVIIKVFEKYGVKVFS